jgi:hypothetical protein
VCKTFGEWYQKTNKTEDTNKLTLFVSSVLFVFWYHSLNVLDTPHICNISRLRVKATSCACGSSSFMWHNPESIRANQLKWAQVLTLLGIFRCFRKMEIVAYYYINVVSVLVRVNPTRVMMVVVLLYLLKDY